VKKIIFLISIVIPFIVIFSQDTDSGLSKKIEGKWEMIKVMELSEDVTESHNPDNDRWIHFKSNSAVDTEGTFVSGKGENNENTGKWIIDKKELFIDSDAGEDDDSYWEISIDNDKMYWKGQRFEFNKRFEIVHRRVE
jgi:hypothetical protein